MAIGYLEMLWHFTARYAPRGDIGRYPDKRIAAALDWVYHDPAKLVQGLVSARWVDGCPVARLVVHDWPDHADEAVRKRLKRDGESFVVVSRNVTGICPDNVRHGCQTLSRLPEPEPEPEPEPSLIGAACERMYLLHPKKKDLSLLPEALENSCRIKALAEIERVHALWCQTEDWKKSNGRYAPSLPQWLIDRGYTREPNNGVAPPLKLNLYTGPCEEVKDGL